MSSLFKKNTSHATLSAMLSTIGVAVAENAGVINTKAVGSQVASFESLSGSDAQNFLDTAATAESVLRESLAQVAASVENFAEPTEAQLKAGVIALLGTGDGQAYARKAMAGSKFTGNTVTTEGISVIEPQFHGAAGFLDYADSHPSLEAYDVSELQNHQAFTVAFNIQASRQSDFTEAFFKTSVHTPDQAGVELTIDNIYVMNEIRHNLNGKTVDFARKNLIRAVSDYTILSAETTRIYPVYLSSGSIVNTANFVSAALVAPSDVSVAGVAYQTAPLAINTKLNLLGLSQTPALVQAGVVEQSDALDTRLALDAIYVKVTPPTGSPKVIKFSTTRLPRAAFYKSVEGNQRGMSLSFDSRQLTINPLTVAVDGTNTVPGVSGLVAGDYKVKLAVTLAGSADVQIGNVQVASAGISVEKLLDGTNSPVDFAAGAGKTLVDAFGTFEVIGYDLEARRTNTNHRTRGILLDTNQWKEQYKVYLGAPITCQKPTSSETGASELSALIAATRVRNDNNGITTLLNHVAQLRQVADSFGNPDEEPNIEGIGRMVIKPYFYETSIDVASSINSIMTHQRDADIRELFGNILRRAAYDMLYKTSYQPALEMISGGTAGKPHVVIGTDPVIQKYLYTQGDSRLFGDAFDFTVVSNIDHRLENTIYMTFTRKDVSGPDPLSFGSFIWIPELASTVEMSRNGQLSREIGVQPRTLHFVTMPVMTVINVTGLKEATNNKTSAPAIG
jgi:uncharacterized protein YfiM (DUF2279 family)